MRYTIFVCWTLCRCTKIASGTNRQMNKWKYEWKRKEKPKSFAELSNIEVFIYLIELSLGQQIKWSSSNAGFALVRSFCTHDAVLCRNVLALWFLAECLFPSHCLFAHGKILRGSWLIFKKLSLWFHSPKIRPRDCCISVSVQRPSNWNMRHNNIKSFYLFSNLPLVE